MKIFSKDFLRGAIDRAIKTAAQVLLAVLLTSAGSDLVPTAGILEIDWLGGLSITALAVVISLLTSISDPESTAQSARSLPSH
ncbi:holin [Gulosibacter molinativorax]|uniref:Holin n=1 Tax=Gulosibacter molinativorax TaxID=256821 RepID=A0ABT7CEM1_9MICO|nr:holin [Gulosibacter molinativorax]MDJ1372766.1 hypothetical protein [Gulosibacter molinativorax]QUY63364.1 Hypotetical protein [Gulosibacter molinativorax]